MLYVGLDLSRKRFDFDALLSDRERFERGAVPPDAARSEGMDVPVSETEVELTLGDAQAPY